ncbi:Uncharacterised protein [Bordetella pertussis]|nr:Uncharacterised protein [Bordetella pertussis]CFU57786.1 Uncharacterised protein [Bordetella pertussis]CPJ85534.1 Uncharacterised protein [Bordetella pertussis]CPO02442.1 Uncharacterised protein [Bordetella pertussis]CPO86194.1 Uncharacterised protein [Bordetella pertussis]
MACTFGNSCFRRSRRTARCTLPLMGASRPSSLSVASRLPPAMPKRSGARVSMPSSSSTCAVRSLMGSLSLCTMRSPRNSTSASITRQRSVRNSCTGRTLSAGCATAFSPSALTDLAPPDCTPISGPRSAMRSRREDSLPLSLGRGCCKAKVMSPCRSLAPTLPLKSRYSKRAPLESWSRATRRPSVEYGGVSGKVTPVRGYRLAIEAPASFRRRSSAPRLMGSVRVPATAIRVEPMATSACTGNGWRASRSASMPPTLPVPSSGRSL